MSAQLLELLFFAGIAFFIVNKFISILGHTNHEDSNSNKSYFGEKANLKDVTGTASNVIDINFDQDQPDKRNSFKYASSIVDENSSKILQNIFELQKRLPSFNPQNFLQNAKSAIVMIIEAASNNKESLKLLIDKRFAEQFELISSNYGVIENKDSLEAKISDLYLFGNNVFIRILFIGQNFTSKIDNFREEWTFSKSLIQSSHDWYLTSVDRPQ
ncbi:MAG: hypothetical protein ACRYE9_04085 [Janthinobacterium lividum]